MNANFTYRLAGFVMLTLACSVLPTVSAQQATIYRCHASSNNQLIFQDKPCDQVAGTKEAQKGSAGDIIPNAPPAPQSDGPPLAERYENYLDAQSARRAAETAAAPPPTAGPASASLPYTYAGGNSGVPAAGMADAYPLYGEGGYPYPVYPPYLERERPPYHDGSGKPTPVNGIGPQPVAKPLPLPSSSFPPLPQRTAPAPSPPAHVVTRDPSR